MTSWIHSIFFVKIEEPKQLNVFSVDIVFGLVFRVQKLPT